MLILLSAIVMSDWTKVVTNPLGLAGFALFLIFGYFAKIRRLDKRRWIAPVAVLLAFSALAGGLVIAYHEVPNSLQQTDQSNKTASSTVSQTAPASKNDQTCMGSNCTGANYGTQVIGSGTQESIVTNNGTLSNSIIANNTITGKPTPRVAPHLVTIDPGESSDIVVRNNIICNINSWDELLDCIDASSANSGAIKDHVAWFQARVDREMARAKDHVPAKTISDCRQTFIDAEKMILDNLNNVHNTVAYLRANPPQCVHRPN